MQKRLLASRNRERVFSNALPSQPSMSLDYNDLPSNRGVMDVTVIPGGRYVAVQRGANYRDIDDAFLDIWDTGILMNTPLQVQGSPDPRLVGSFRLKGLGYARVLAGNDATSLKVMYVQFKSYRISLSIPSKYSFIHCTYGILQTDGHGLGCPKLHESLRNSIPR